MTESELQELVLYRDALMLVINKPTGIAVHPGRGKTKQNLQETLQELKFGLPNSPELAHRLDAGTSGCLVLGRHKHALKKLGQLFDKNMIDKTYWAIIQGTPENIEGQIDLPLAKQQNKSHTWWMKVDQNGKPSLTHYKVLEQGNDLALVELKPVTGRTHQLRVHCAAMGWPILGDTIYGQKSQSDLLCLHAYSIQIPLYPKKNPIFVVAPPPPHMKKLFKSINI